VASTLTANKQRDGGSSAGNPEQTRKEPK